jgi:S1-C subfamily serine protease
VRRISALIIAALVAATVIGGCGGDGDGDGGSSTVERTRVQVVEGLGGKNGFNPSAIYERLSPGVVTVTSLFGDQTLRQILGGEGSAGQGSGFVLDGDGYIATNAHVVTDGTGDKLTRAREVFVQFEDGNQVKGEIVGYDPNADVGVVKVDPKGLELVPLSFAPTRDVKVGEPVAAIGSPFGQESSLSVGVVSATERSIDSITSGFNLVDAIQTDAPINRGNSGGPMFDAEGDVIGINAQIRSESGTAEGVGFAIPINAARRSMEQLIQTGEVRYAWLGVTTQSVTPRMAERFGLAETSGAAVQSVAGGSPADQAGLRGGSGEEEFDGLTFCPGGDVIVAVDGQPVGSAEDVVRAVNQQRLPGDEIRLTILRGSERLELTATLGDRPANPPTLTC